MFQNRFSVSTERVQIGLGDDKLQTDCCWRLISVSCGSVLLGKQTYWCGTCRYAPVQYPSICTIAIRFLRTQQLSILRSNLKLLSTAPVPCTDAQKQKWLICACFNKQLQHTASKQLLPTDHGARADPEVWPSPDQRVQMRR